MDIPSPVDHSRAVTGDNERLMQIVWLAMFALAWGALLLSIPGYIKGFDLLESFETASPVVLAADIVGRFTSLVAALISLGVAHLLYRHRQNRVIALYAAFYALLMGIVSAGTVQAAASYWLGSPDAIQFYFPEALISAPGALFILTFPTGRFVPRWGRWVFLAYVLAGFSGFFVPPPDAPDRVRALRDLIDAIWFLALPIPLIYALVVRYRRYSTPDEKQQTRWVLYGFAVFMVLMVLSAILYSWRVSLPRDTPVPWWVVLNSLVFWGGFAVFPVAFAIAILYHRLWNIDIIINRTLVYATLTGFVVGTYTLIVGALGAIFQARGSLIFSLLATATVAVLFQPLRDRVQRTVNRLMFGQRDEPYRVISQLGQRLEGAFEPAAVLPTIVETVAGALRLPYAAILLEQDGELRPAAVFGAPLGESLRLPLVYANETIGELALSPRAPGESFTPPDFALLETLAQQIGVAAHAVMLTADLERSRQRIVTEREDARRRLGSDLHDGIGHRLAGIMRRVEMALNHLDNDPETARATLKALTGQLQTTIGDVRALSHSLYPPELELLGLNEALQESARQYHTAGDDGLQIVLDVPAYLPPLPVAIQAAAYYIAREALTNVSRHARARHCWLRLSLVDSVDTLFVRRMLELEVRDDGVGINGAGHGLGMTSMRNRAEELGGALTVEKLDTGGTRVLAHLPCLGEQ